jgi:hypothetical protein
VILLNNGDGTFRQGPTLQIDSTIQATAVAAGDLNADGKIDLAIAAFEEQGPGDGVAIFLGNGDGTFHPETLAITGEPGPVNLAITDLDQDGKLDLVVNFCCGTGRPPSYWSIRGVVRRKPLSASSMIKRALRCRYRSLFRKAISRTRRHLQLPNLWQREQHW